MTIIDNGDAPIEAGWAADDDPFMKNRQRIIDYMPRLVIHVQRALGGRTRPVRRPGCSWSAGIAPRTPARWPA